MRHFWQDLRYAVKALRGDPTYSIAAIATLGLALAATTTMFSVVTAVVLRPLPVRAQDSVVVVWAKHLRRDFPHIPFSHREFRLARERSRTLRGVAAMVLREGIVLAAIGTTVGIGSALAAGRSLRASLYGISSTDWVTLAGTAIVMLTIALCASYIPARRATRVDPIIALRSD